MIALLLALLAQDPVAKIDAPVQDWKLRDLTRDGNAAISLSDYQGKKTLVLVFTSYTCDACIDYEERFRKIMNDFQGKDVAFLGVRSSAEDNAADMRKYVETKKLGISVLDDPKNKMANYFKVRVTPTFCIIDQKGLLRFWGGCDDNINEKRATKTFVHDALSAVLAGKDVPIKEAKVLGCHMPRAEDDK